MRLPRRLAVKSTFTVANQDSIVKGQWEEGRGDFLFI